MDQAVKHASEAQSGHRGKLRIGSVGIIATDFLPKTLKLFHQKYPGVEVIFVEMLPTEQMNALVSGKIDIGFAYGKDPENLPGLRKLCVIHSSFGVAVSRQHPLGKRDNVILKDLRWETLLCLGDDGKSSHREAMYQIYSAEGFKPNKHRHVEAFDTMITLIAADQGVTLLPHVLDLANQDIIIVPLVSVKSTLDFHMWAVWQDDARDLHVNEFIKMLHERV